MEQQISNISIIIPCYNSEKTICSVIEEINGVDRLKTIKYELILVNDGSSDNTFKIISMMASNNKNITAIDLSKNFGQHNALMAGLRFCSGDVVVCMDDDGQTPASGIDLLLDKLQEGYDVIYAKYPHKQHSVFRNIGTKINDLMTRVLLGKPKHLFLSSFFCMRRYVVDEIAKYDNPYPYIMGLVLRATKNITNVEINHRSRVIGESGYTFRKLIKLWINGFTAFSIIPLRIVTVIGMLFAATGFLYGIWIIIKKVLLNTAPMGWSSLVAMILFIGGIVLMMQGMLGEYIGRIYLSINRNPQYVIREIVKGDLK